MKKTILFIDNKVDFLNLQAQLLEEEGYHILKAASVREAEEKLSEQYVHLAMVDIRLQAENEPNDISGLALVGREEYRDLPKIILTAYPSWEYAEQALGMVLETKLVCMVDKADGPQAVLEAIEKSFTGYVHINWELLIRWSNAKQFSLLHLATLVSQEADSSPFTARLIDELEDLLRRLFYKSEQINVGSLVQYRRGKVYFTVFAYNKNGIEQTYLVAYGQRPLIDEENKRREELLDPIDNGRNIRFAHQAATAHFAAVAYSLPHTAVGQLQTFKQYYYRHEMKEVRTVLENLFKQTLTPWYVQGHRRDTLQNMETALRDWQGLARKQPVWAALEQQLKQLCQEMLTADVARVDYNERSLSLYLPHQQPRLLPNPVAYLRDNELHLRADSLCGTIHGQLDSETILLNAEGTATVIDFGQAQNGPLVQDFASLELTVVTELLALIDVDRQLEVGQRLGSQLGLSEPLDLAGLTGAEQKGVTAVAQIRQAAATLVGEDPQAYFAALLLGAVHQLTPYDPAVRHTQDELFFYLQNLLLAALLCQHFIPEMAYHLPPEAQNGGLWIDTDNRDVYIDQKIVKLSPREFDLLHYLYEHKGRLRTRRQIAIEVFGARYEDDTDDWEVDKLDGDRINATMNRLRQKIEPNAEYPFYVITERGKGYKLNLPA